MTILLPFGLISSWIYNFASPCCHGRCDDSSREDESYRDFANPTWNYPLSWQHRQVVHLWWLSYAPRCLALKYACGTSSQLLVDLLLSSHLNQLVTEPTTYRSGHNPSTLDLIIASDDNSLTNLEYLGSICISDHSVLKVYMQMCSLLKARTVSFTRTIIDYKSANKDLSKVDWPGLFSGHSVVQHRDSFKNMLRDCISKVFYFFVCQK